MQQRRSPAFPRFRRAAAALLPLACAFLAAGSAAAAAGTRPNVVLILLDDQDATTSPYWQAMPRTRALLRDRGVEFTNAFSPTPICCPARATLLTGKLGHNTGILTNGGENGGWETFRANGNEDRTLAVWLEAAGYRTALMGKYLNGIEAAPTYVPPGWTEWYGFADNASYFGYGYDINQNGTLVSYGTAPEDYQTDVLTRLAVDFVARAESDDARPFFLYLAPTAPHLPIPPAPRHANHPFADAVTPRRPNYQEADLADKPLWLRASGAIRAANVALWNDTDYRNRMGSLYAVDDMIARLVAELAARGELANTWFLFTSDNGYNLGAHRLIHKMAPYEESIRVPLVIAGPGVPLRLRGTQEARFALESDLAPTIADLAGVPVPSDVDGRSLAPIVRGTPPASWRREVLLQYETGGAANGIGAELPPALFVLLGQEIPTYRALRTDRHLYVEWYDPERSANERELYDLRVDPYQLDNRLGTPLGRLLYRGVAEDLAARLDEVSRCSGASCP